MEKRPLKSFSIEELNAFNQDRVEKLISCLKRIMEEAEKQNDHLRYNRHGSKFIGTYFFYVNKELFIRFIDVFAAKYYNSLIDYLGEKFDSDRPQHVCPLFGLIINTGIFHDDRMKNTDYRDAMETVFTKSKNRTCDKHRSDVGGYCVKLMSNYKIIKKQHPLLCENVLEICNSLA